MRQSPKLSEGILAAAAIGAAVMGGTACAEDRTFDIRDTASDSGSDSDGGNSGNGGQGGDAGTEGGSGGTAACPDTETQCGTKCVDVYTDPDNCGGCGNICDGVKNACANAVCSCEVGLTDCHDGFCTDTKDDNDNCGGCGNVCDSNEHCSEGFCKQ